MYTEYTKDELKLIYMNTKREKLAFIKRRAKEFGLVLQEEKNFTINGGKAYKFIHKKTLHVVIESCTFGEIFLLAKHPDLFYGISKKEEEWLKM